MGLLMMTSLAAAEELLELGAPFADHAVLQREMPVPVWGWSKPGTQVSVAFAGQKKTAVAEKDGKWKLALDPLKASAKPSEMVISQAGGASLTVRDLLVGEVWLASGQSNMQMNIGESSRDAMDKKDQPVVWTIREEAKKHKDPLIRQLKAPLATSYNKGKNK